MALYLPIRAISRSQSVRVGNQKITRDQTHYVDISVVSNLRALEHHSALGAIIEVGTLSSTDDSARVVEGVEVTEGTSATDRSVRVLAGELRRDDGSYVTVDQQDVDITPGHATLGRIDAVVVDKTTGVVTVVVGTPSASPVAPTVPATKLRLANVTVVAVSGAGGTNEVQEVAVDAEGGTYTLTYDDEETATIAFDASDTTGADSVRAKLVALPNIGTSDVAVTGGPGDNGGTAPYVITFQGALAETDVVLLTADDTLLTGGAGTATVSLATAGDPAGIADAAITDTRPRI